MAVSRKSCADGRAVAKACVPKLCRRIETIAKSLRAKALHCRANRPGGRS